MEPNEPTNPTVPDPNFYVGDRMDQNTLDNIERVFHLKYSNNSEASSSDVVVLSGFEPSDLELSSDENEDTTMEGVDPNNLIHMFAASDSSVDLSEQSDEIKEMSDNE
ncbi:hypothetical protein S245_069756 [Arachis hypogaea]